MFDVFKFLKKKKDDGKSKVQEGAEKELKVGEEKAEDYEKEAEKNVAIHVMPERFRVAAGKKDSAKTVGIFIIGGGALLLIAASVLLYFFLIKGGKPKPGPVATSTGATVRENEKENNANREREREIIKSQEVGTTTFPIIPPENRATSTATSSPEMDELISFTPGSDQDKDGLTDKEEALFGSNPNNTDSDGDGYNDFAEVNNLYNPAGQEKLESSSAIKNYVNTTYKYSLLYPVSWSLNKIGGDDSVIIQSSDNHFIQIIIEPYSKKESIEEWYKAQFGVAELLREIFTRDGWRGIKSDNDLILYLTDSNNNYLYTITYNLGENTVLEYKNIFEMLIKSFAIKS
jgi:hypothetical protein